MMKLITAFVLVTSLFAAPITLAQQADSPGGEDHPMVTRYEGSFIDGMEVHEWDEFELPLGPAVWGADGVKVPKEKATLEGRITRILYRGPDGKSTLDIVSNYQSALEGAGFETLYKCGSDCGNSFEALLYGPTEKRIRKTETSGSAFDIPQDVRFLAARLTDSDRVVHVAVLAAYDNGFGALSKRPVTLLQIIEAKSMDTGMVTVDADAIGKGIDATGHMAIYGVQFDTNSSRIKVDSSPVLAEIAKLLESRPSLNLLVVGHTDNQGEFEYNMNLSNQRAHSVVNHLVERHGIDKGRLNAAGVGYLAPVATNDSPDGRARNRRVELVKDK